jgi:hypothetical protein
MPSKHRRHAKATGPAPHFFCECSDACTDAYAAWLRASQQRNLHRQGLRVNADLDSTLRTNVSYKESPMDHDTYFRSAADNPLALEPPDSYGLALAAERAAQGIPDTTDATADRIADAMEFRARMAADLSASVAASQVPATSDAHLNPPDGYAMAIAQENRR